MTKKNLKVSAIAAILAYLCAGVNAAVTVGLAPGSRLWLEGKSTLHPYESKATQVDFSLRLGTTADALQALAAGIETQAPAQMEVRIPVSGLKSEYKGLDENLRKTLKADKFPDIVFNMAGYRLVKDSGTSMIVAWGDLSVTGVKKPATLNAALSWKDGRAIIDGQQPILMSDFGVKPPTLMLGALKTDDRVVVKFHLELEQGNAR